MPKLRRAPWLAARVALLAVLMALALALPGSTQASDFHEIKKVTASDAPGGNLFGIRSAVSGDTAIVTAILESTGGSRAGAAYVFQRDHGGPANWGEVKKLTASNPSVDDWFGIGLAISGDTAIVGAYFEDSLGSNAGAAYIFQRDQGGPDNWGQVKKLTASDGQAGDIFGVSVALSGDTAVIGAYGEDAGGANAGAAYVFHRNEGGVGNWGEVKKLTASDAEAGDWFTWSVAISGNTAVVGAIRKAVDAEAGAAYIFRRDHGGADNWGQVRKLTASDAQAGDRFGGSVAVNGDTSIVGADRHDDLAGAAYVFQQHEGGTDNWGEVKKLLASDADEGDRFAASVALSGKTAVLGAYREGDTGAGAAYVFRRDEGGSGNWGEVRKLTASDARVKDLFGISLAASGSAVIVGAQGEGAAYVFDLLISKPTATITPTPSFTPTSTFTPTITLTPTQTPTAPLAVGGIALDADLRSLPLETNSAHSAHWSSALAIAAAANFVALGSFLWYTRRKRSIS